MAEQWEEDYEVKDEELVDFEGSDYGFDSADEEVEEAAVVVVAAERNGSDHKLLQQPIVAPLEEKKEEKGVEKKKKEEEKNNDNNSNNSKNNNSNKSTGALKLQNLREEEKAEKKRSCGVEQGGGGHRDYHHHHHHHRHHLKEDGSKKDATVAAAAPPPQVSKSSVGLLEGEGKGLVLSRQRKHHHKADLEDGELDDAAMPEGSDPEAEAKAGGDDEDEIEHRERKRRKSRFAAERSSDDMEKNKYPEGVALAQFRHSRGQGSRTNVDHSSNASRVARSMTAVGFNPPNIGVGGPGIMGPGRPPISLEFGPIPFNAQGLPGPLGWMPTTGRPEMPNHIMEAMAAQEYILRSHQHMMQLAHANLRGPVRPSIGGPPIRPFMGLDVVDPRLPVGPQQIMHLQVNQAHDVGMAMNFPGRVDAARRMLQQPVFGTGPGAGGMMNQFTNRPGLSPAIGAVRQQGVWASPSIGSQMQQLPIGRARGQGQGQGQLVGPLWGDFQAQGGISTGIPAHSGGIGQGVAINVGPGFGPGGMMDMGSPKRQSSLPQMMRGSIDANREIGSHMNREAHLAEVNGLRRVDEGHKGVGTSNGLVPQGFWPANPGVAPTDIKRERESVQHHRQRSFSHPVPGAVAAPIRHLDNGKGPNVGTAGNHLIQLGGQLQKSRVLIVSGLSENTSMAVVVEAFEKQGKITDFKKEERGNAFAITFASVQEATSAKRSLHRTVLAGEQITVEYAMPRF